MPTALRIGVVIALLAATFTGGLAAPPDDPVKQQHADRDALRRRGVESVRGAVSRFRPA